MYIVLDYLYGVSALILKLQLVDASFTFHIFVHPCASNR